MLNQPPTVLPVQDETIFMITKRAPKRTGNATGVVATTATPLLYLQNQLRKSHRLIVAQDAFGCFGKCQFAERRTGVVTAYFCVHVGRTIKAFAVAGLQAANLVEGVCVVVTRGCDGSVSLVASMLAESVVSVHAPDVSAFRRIRNGYFQKRALTGQYHKLRTFLKKKGPENVAGIAWQVSRRPD